MGHFRRQTVFRHAACFKDDRLWFVLPDFLVQRGPPLLGQYTWRVAGSAAVTVANRWNVAPLTTPGFFMIFFCLMWVSLVLGGAAGCLPLREALRGKWLRMARVWAPVRLPVWQRAWGVPRSPTCGGVFRPPPWGVVRRTGPPPWPPAW